MNCNANANFSIPNKPSFWLPSNYTFWGILKPCEMSEHDWKNTWFTSMNSTNPKLPSQKSYIFRFRVNHISHTHSRPKSSIYYRRLSWNSACDSFGAWILKKVEIIIRDTGRVRGIGSRLPWMDAPDLIIPYSLESFQLLPAGIIFWNVCFTFSSRRILLHFTI